jgi:triacylglycerol lipase
MPFQHPATTPSTAPSSALARQLRGAQFGVLGLTLLTAQLCAGGVGWPHLLGLLGLGVLSFVAASLCLLLGLFALSMLVSAQDTRADARAAHKHSAWPTAWRALWREASACWRVFVIWQPWRWRDVSDNVPGPDPQARAAVVLVHGYACNRGIWRVWMHRLRERATPFLALNLEPVWGSIDDHVGQIEGAVTQAALLGTARPWLVCHSMGGLAVRAWLAQTPGAHARIAGLVTLGTPHHGTWLARWGLGCKAWQMQTGSPWLARLAQLEADRCDLAWRSVHVLSVQAPADQVVFPAHTAVWGPSTTWSVAGHGHVSMVVDEDLLERCLAWMDKRSP